MRKPFAGMMALVLVLGSTLPAVRPASPETIFADAPPPPTLPVQAPLPAGPDIGGQPWPTPPSPYDLPPEVDQARARQAVEAVLEKHLRYWGPRYQVAPVEVTVEGEWAYGIARWQSQARTLQGPIHILAHRSTDGTWQALMPGSDGLYLQWVDAVPESLVPVGKKSQLRTQAAEVGALRHPVRPPTTITVTTQPPRPLLPSESWAPVAPVPAPVPLPQPETWIAGETSVSRLSKEERARLCGVPVEVIEWERLQASQEPAEPEAVYSYPSTKDWRNANGQDWTTAIRNQGGCGSCVAFGTIGAIESRMEIVNGNPGLNPDLSEAHLFFCNGRQCNKGDPNYGWRPDAAMSYARDTGIVDEACYPYSDYNQSCNLCSNWESRVTKIAGWTGTSNVAEMKQALADYGPFEVTLAVYDDFFSYSEGIYRYTWGNLAGGHAVTVVGYNDDQGYWIVKNSWGTGWGEDGWFRIAYGECEIDDYAYIPNVNPPPSCDPNADQVALFVDTNYSGQCVVKGIGQYPNPGAIGLPNDSISSVRVGGNVKAILCENDGYAGICEPFTGDDPDLSNNSIGDDRVSSVKVEQRVTPCNPNADQIALYADAGYGGSCVTLDIGDYPNPSYLGSLGNDNAESIKVGGDVQATLCEHDDYLGRCETFAGDDSNLNDNNIGADVVSSVKVQSRDTTPPTGQITSPSDGDVITACPLTIQAEASDDQSGVSHVEFHAYYDDSWHHLGDDHTSPYSWNWDCSSVSDQGVWLTIHVWDNAGNEAMDPSGYVYITLSSATIGPLMYDSRTIDDDNNDQSSGDGDGVVECGETIELYVTLHNQGDGTATGVNATISTSDPYVTWLYNTNSSYPDISSGGTGTNSNDFDFSADPATPNGHTIQFDLDINASNGGPWSDSFSVSVECPGSGPDLVPSQWGGWQYPIVPSSITGTVVVNTLYADYPTYIDWGISNSGDEETGGDAYGDLYIDDTRLAHYNFGNVLAGWTWAFFDWMETVNTPGWHTLKFIADPDDLVAESDETNNAWQRDFYWTPVAPYADDMESGNNDWTATGLWHQVDGYTSPYPRSHSWSHSWWYGQDATGDYDTGTTNSGDLTSPPVYIPSTGYYLRFWYRYETETQGQSWDQRWVQISVDDGPFNDVLQLYDDPMNWWLQSPAIDLSGYAGHTVQVRFRFDSVDAYFNDYRGWYIDDFEISTTPPPSCADGHEPNDTPAQATAIAYTQVITADICPGGDYDFYTFTGTAGDKVVIDIDAKANDSLLDSYIFLLDSDGTSVLAENDDEILVEIQDSHLGYQLPHDGTYYIKVRAWNHPSVGGTDYFYTIHLLTDDVSPTAEITSPDHNAWLDPNLQVVTTDVSDAESGIRNVTFYWHDADWDNSDWIVLEDDRDPRDGWTYEFDTSGIPEQPQGCVVFIYAYDWAGNYAGYGSYGLGLDRTPPAVTAGVQQMYGDAPFRDFWVHWWDSWDNLSGVASYDVQYRDGTGGTWTNLVISTTQIYTRFVGIDGHTYYFRARARDLASNQSIYADGDGDVQHTVDICDTPADAYEGDDVAGNAQWFTPDGFSQIHNMHTDGDQDWVKFYAEADITYTLATANAGGHADTVLYLYDTDGSSLIDSNDDYPGRWPASRLDWQPAANGVYYARVDHWDPWAYGCTTEYGLSITTHRTPSLELGEPGLSFRYTGTFGTTGEPYLADADRFNSPHSVAVDNAGNLYVTESEGQRLLKFDSSGVFQWSIGVAGVSGWGNDHFDHPLKVAVDSNNDRVYVADMYAHRIQVFDTGGNYVKTIGVTGESGSDNDHFNEPKGVAVDTHGNLYVADTMNHRVQIFDSIGAHSATLGAGRGTGDYQFGEPEGVAFDSAGNIYVADFQNHRVQIFTPGLVYSVTLGVSGEAGDDNGHFNLPNTVVLDNDDNVYVVDLLNQRVQKFDENLNYLATLGETGVIGSDNAHFYYPTGAAIDPNTGNLYVADVGNFRVQKFNSSHVYQYTIGATGVPYQTDSDHFNRPADVAADSSGNIFLAEERGHRLLKLDSSGAVQAVIGTASIAGDDNEHFSDPFGLAVDDSGRVYVADKDNHRVQIFDNALNYVTTIGTGDCGTGDDAFCGPHKAAIGANGDIYVVDTWNERVQVFDSSYNYIATLGITDEQGSDNNHFREPRGVAVGAGGNVYVADFGNARVQKCTVVGTSGSCTTFAGETGVIGDDFGHLRAPLDVAVDAQGRVYICDSYWNQRIQVFDSDGAYLTTIGGEWGEKNGQFRNPAGIDLDTDGNLYVADSDNARVQKFAPGVPDWQQVNINGFGDKESAGGGISLQVLDDHLYAGLGNPDGGRVWRTPDGSAWTQVTDDGFGTSDNTSINLGATFNGHLYAGTWNQTTGCEVHRSNDGLSWTRVVSGGFGDGHNAGIGTMAVFDNYLYVSTYNGSTGVEIWRTPDGIDWTQVYTDGFDDSNNIGAWSMAIFDDALYAGTQNFETGAEIWRTSGGTLSGTNWEQVNADGFGDAHNQWPSLAVYDGYLYVGTANDSTDTYTGTGTQIWRSADGTSWEQVVGDGFGDATNGGSDTLVVFGPHLYAGTYNRETGTQLRRTTDGVHWTEVAPDGFGDSNSYSTYGSAVFGHYLFLATANEAHGAEVWQSALQLAQADFTGSPTSGVVPLTVDFTNQSTGDYDTCAWNFGDGGTSENCSDPSHEYVLVGVYTVTLTVDGPGGSDIEIKAEYITVEEKHTIYLPLVMRNG